MASAICSAARTMLSVEPALVASKSPRLERGAAFPPGAESARLTEAPPIQRGPLAPATPTSARPARLLPHATPARTVYKNQGLASRASVRLRAPRGALRRLCAGE